MSESPESKIIEDPQLHNRLRVFRDRREAGEALARLLERYRPEDAVVLGIPAGGVPVAAVVAERLGLPLDAAVVSKITLPWNSEAGYGAVAFDGTVKLNDALVSAVGLSEPDIQTGIATTRERVRRRDEAIRGGEAMPDAKGKALIVIDDGIASGFTVRTAIEALRKLGPKELVLATPTARLESLEKLLDSVDAVFCANVRSGAQFAVADAYRRWTDVDETDAIGILAEARSH